MRLKCGLVALSVIFLAATCARADVWDISTDSDDTPIGTDNDLQHGAVQVHDFGVRPGPVADEDWWVVLTEPFSSYEFVAGDMVGDVGQGGLTFDHTDITGATVLGTAVLVGGLNNAGHFTQSLRWENATATGVSELIHGFNAVCGTACDVNDQYTVKFYETTLSVPRFNNTGTQATVLVIENNSQDTVAGNVHLWNPAGTHLGAAPFSIAPHGVFVQNTAAMPGGGGAAGALTITNNGRFGSLAAKTVVLDPGTGFSFDTPGSYKPL